MIKLEVCLMETMQEREQYDELERVLEYKIAEWEYDRSEQKEEHSIKINELVKRIQQIKENGNGKEEKEC